MKCENYNYKIIFLLKEFDKEEKKIYDEIIVFIYECLSKRLLINRIVREYKI